MDLTYRILNVFAESKDPFSGNAVCLFEQGSGLSDETMMSIARQLNLETVFIRASTPTSADITFYAPHGKSRFAGSASLGTAFVIHEMYGQRVPMVLTDSDGQQMNMQPSGKDNWAVRAREGYARKLKSSPQILASLVGLPMSAISDEVMVIDAGRSGVVLPVNTPDDVTNAHLDARMLHSYAMLLNTEPQVYVWAHSAPDAIVSRMFYGPSGGVVEVAATGSGAANLGNWFAAHGRHGTWRIRQGAAVGRPSVLDLEVRPDNTVYVGGHVNHVATGTISF